eukprot:TRINITY_DN135049_c1_g1_i1.p3 TRINITY_DN135049_c1_g1~~TRINITY_DN135049_c1_g1_i1.p3  ORF type:complete len:252 (+),score=22.20 TRINITY_DN135049_c1_g1_i1:1491-2246(+)
MYDYQCNTWVDVSCVQRNSNGYINIGKVPKLMLTCLRGGKAYSSKVKFSRFGFVYENEIGKTGVLKDVQTLYGLARKQLASGKQGEAGIKPVSGSFICPMDTIGEALKVLEEAVKNSKLSNVKIFIGCNANEVYNETSGKYEMEGAKSQFDSNQMVEYYVKFLTEHPLVVYLEDPMSDKDLHGWHLLTVFYYCQKAQLIIGKTEKGQAECGCWMQFCLWELCRQSCGADHLQSVERIHRRAERGKRVPSKI